MYERSKARDPCGSFLSGAVAPCGCSNLLRKPCSQAGGSRQAQRSSAAVAQRGGDSTPAPARLRAECPDTRASSNAQFPWIGRWTNRGALVWPGTPAAEAWRRYGSTAGTVDLLQLRKFICHRAFENSFPLIKTSLTQPRKRASPRTASC